MTEGLEQIDHVNIVVDDLQKMETFYCGLLGLRVTLRARLEGDWIEEIVGIAGVVADCIYLQPENGPRIELLKYISPPGVQPEALGLGHTRGIRHIAFRVADIDLIWKKLTAAGVSFLSPPVVVPLASVTQTTGRKRLCYFHDPEGNLLEFCEYN